MSLDQSEHNSFEYNSFTHVHTQQAQHAWTNPSLWGSQPGCMACYSAARTAVMPMRVRAWFALDEL